MKITRYINNSKSFLKIKNIIQNNQLLEQQYNSLDTISSKLDTIIQSLKKSKFPIIITGAGVSTMSGIPDYRTTHNTSLPTGPGKWNRNPDQLIEYLKINPLQADPNLAHWQIASIFHLFKYLLTQNVDNLHTRSGIPSHKILKLHGQYSEQYCEKCSKVYKRGYFCWQKGKFYNGLRWTGRFCQCGGRLYDSLVNFGQTIHPQIKAKLKQIQIQSDFLLCLGTSLVVNSSSKIATDLYNRNKPVYIVNLQKLKKPYTLSINGLIHEILGIMMKKMGITLVDKCQKYQIHFKFNNHITQVVILNHDGEKVDFIEEIKNEQGKQLILERKQKQMSIIFKSSKYVSIKFFNNRQPIETQCSQIIHIYKKDKKWYIQ